MEQIEKIEGLNPIESNEIVKIKKYLDTLALAKQGARSLTKEELDLMLSDFTNFSKKLEEEKQRLPSQTETFDDALKSIAIIIGFLILLGIIVYALRKE